MKIKNQQLTKWKSVQNRSLLFFFLDWGLKFNFEENGENLMPTRGPHLHFYKFETRLQKVFIQKANKKKKTLLDGEIY